MNEVGCNLKSRAAVVRFMPPAMLRKRKWDESRFYFVNLNFVSSTYLNWLDNTRTGVVYFLAQVVFNLGFPKR